MLICDWHKNSVKCRSLHIIGIESFLCLSEFVKIIILKNIPFPFYVFFFPLPFRVVKIKKFVKKILNFISILIVRVNVIFIFLIFKYQFTIIISIYKYRLFSQEKTYFFTIVFNLFMFYYVINLQIYNCVKTTTII